MRFIFVFLVFLAVLAACSPFPVEEVKRAKLEIEAMYYADVPRYLPDEWGLLRDAWQKLDEAERTRDRLAATRWFSYVMQKSLLIEDMIAEKKKEEEKERLRKEQERKRISEKTVQEIKDKPQETVISEPQKEVVAVPKRKKTIADVRYKIEKRFPSFYTVSDDGETLEEIAAMPAIYNDRYYWPLIYKFNRNQVGDPKRLYKGQILKIPRNITLEDIYRAREEAKAKTPRVLPKSAFTPERYKNYIEELLSED